MIQDPDSSDSEHEHIKSSSSSRKRVKVFGSSYFDALFHSGFEQSDSEESDNQPLRKVRKVKREGSSSKVDLSQTSTSDISAVF